MQTTYFYNFYLIFRSRFIVSISVYHFTDNKNVQSDLVYR